MDFESWTGFLSRTTLDLWTGITECNFETKMSTTLMLKLSCLILIILRFDLLFNLFQCSLRYFIIYIVFFKLYASVFFDLFHYQFQCSLFQLFCSLLTALLLSTSAFFIWFVYYFIQCSLFINIAVFIVWFVLLSTLLFLKLSSVV